MKYKEGDKVRIKTNLIPDKRYGGNTFVSEMLEFTGKDTIVNIVSGNKYYLEIDKEKGYWCWTDEMLEPVSEYPKKMLVSNNKVDWHKRKIIGHFPELDSPYLSKSLYAMNSYAGYKYAEDLPQPKELTMQEIADKFGISVEQLKIKK